MSKNENWHLRYLKENPPQYDKSKPHKFVVQKSSGEYEDSYTASLAIVDTASEALKMVEELYEQEDKIKNLAIKDTYYEDDYDGGYIATASDTEDDEIPKHKLEYSNLKDEWSKYTILSLFPRLKESEKERDYWGEEIIDDLGLSPEEINRYYDVMSEEETYFKKFMIEEKGISPEVANATIEYNNISFYDRNVTYDYEPVPYYPSK